MPGAGAFCTTISLLMMTPAPPEKSRQRVAIVGGGPAGLMAAETLSRGGAFDIHVYDAMPSVGRKFLLAGRGGMNITHAEPIAPFLGRYGARRGATQPPAPPTAARARR